MLPSALENAIGRYIELELEIDRLTSEKFAGLCAECGGLCCRAGHANLTLRSWFLREVSRRVHGRWWPDDWETREGCVAQTQTGCLLRAGRPGPCRQWFCEPYLAPCKDVWEVVFYGFLCELPLETTRLSPSMDLVELTAEQAARHAALIAERLERSGRLFAAARRLIAREASELEKHRVALGLLCSVPAILQGPACQAILDRMPGLWGSRRMAADRD